MYRRDAWLNDPAQQRIYSLWDHGGYIHRLVHQNVGATRHFGDRRQRDRVAGEGDRPVRKIEAGIKGTAVQKISWDGKDQSGSSLPDGVYTFRVVAADENGKAITVTTYREGPVTGISLENGKAMFQLDNDLISFDDIKTILG